MKIPMELQAILSSDPDVMHGKVCFVGTRVPVSVFLDNFQQGMGSAEFLEEYPTVSAEQLAVIITWTKLQAEKSLGLDFAS